MDREHSYQNRVNMGLSAFDQTKFSIRTREHRQIKVTHIGPLPTQPPAVVAPRDMIRVPGRVVGCGSGPVPNQLI